MSKEERIRKAISKEKSRLHLSTIVVLLIVIAGCFYYAYSYFQGSSEGQSSSQTTADVEKIMSEFIQESLKEEYQPDSIEPQQINTEGKLIYRADWEYNGIKLFSVLKYNNIEEPELMVGVLQPKIDNLDKDISMNLADDFFKYNTEGKWNCLSGNTIKACEKLWFEEEGKMSIGVGTIFNAIYSTTYACKISPKSDRYNDYMCAVIV